MMPEPTPVIAASSGSLTEAAELDDGHDRRADGGCGTGDVGLLDDDGRWRRTAVGDVRARGRPLALRSSQPPGRQQSLRAADARPAETNARRCRARDAAALRLVATRSAAGRCGAEGAWRGWVCAGQAAACPGSNQCCGRTAGRCPTGRRRAAGAARGPWGRHRPPLVDPAWPVRRAGASRRWSCRPARNSGWSFTRAALL